MVSEIERRGRGKKEGAGCCLPAQDIRVTKQEAEESFAVVLALQDRQKRMRRIEEELEPDAML
ncbi:Uncharacterised protein [Candidatus Burarchaeum australiense]|nr:Uncharacterised protein [Candidatus Burarchaeum australiense]